MYYILVSSNCPCFHIFSEHIAYILSKNNKKSAIFFNEITCNKDFSEDYLIVFWNSIRVESKYNFKKVFIYNMDTPTIERFSIEVTEFINSFTLLKTNISVMNFSSNESDKEFFQKFNIEYNILPYGYSDFHEKIYSITPKVEEKTIDVLFYGAITEYRRPKLILIDEFCKKNNYKAIFVSNVFNELEKSKLIEQSKITICIPSSEGIIKAGTNDLCRVAFLISTKSFVISHRIWGDTENTLESYGLPYVSNMSELLEKITYYLKNSDERKNICEQAYEKFKVDYNFEKMLLNVISQ